MVMAIVKHADHRWSQSYGVIKWCPCLGDVRSVMPDMLRFSYRTRAEIMASSDTRAVEAIDRARLPVPRPL
jgi:hypothetical protein